LSSLFGENEEVIHHPADFVHPGVVLENKERSTILFKAISKLADNQKIAFTLHHVEGLSYQEITEVMQLSLSSVESLLFRAKSNLRTLLKEYYAKEVN
jgi:RNA polymerase sigma-70 factor (ECF subfamily)